MCFLSINLFPVHYLRSANIFFFFILTSLFIFKFLYMNANKKKINHFEFGLNAATSSQNERQMIILQTL